MLFIFHHDTFLFLMDFELQCNQTVIREYLCTLPHNAVFEVVVVILWYSLVALAILNVLEFVYSNMSDYILHFKQLIHCISFS